MNIYRIKDLDGDEYSVVAPNITKAIEKWVSERHEEDDIEEVITTGRGAMFIGGPY